MASSNADASEPATPVSPRGAGVVWPVAALVLVAVATFYLLNALEAEHPWINHDVGYHGYLGEQMAQGRQLYVDIKEDNPPGSPLLLGMLFRLGDALALPDFVTPHFFVLLLGLAGLGVLHFALRGRDADWVWGLTALAYLAVVVRGGFSNSLYVDAPELPYDFGQREHLFSLLFLPYVFFRLKRRRSPWWFLGFVVLLGFVATFKPFWAPMVLCVELFVRWRDGRWDLRVLASLALGLVLPIVGLALHSLDSLREFITWNIPMYLRGGFNFFDDSFAEFVRTGLHTRMMLGGVLLAAGLVFARSTSRAERGLFALLALVAYYAVWHQHKFWSYHTMPFFALTLVPATYLVARAVTSQARMWLARGVLAVAASGLLLLSARTVSDTAKMLNRFPPVGSFFCSIVEPYERVMYFSMSVMVQYPSLRLDREWVGPWTLFFDFPEILGMQDAAEREVRLREYAAEVRRTVERERPELLVFSPQNQALPPGTTLHDLFERLGVIPPGQYRRVTPGALGSKDPLASKCIFYLRNDLHTRHS